MVNDSLFGQIVEACTGIVLACLPWWIAVLSGIHQGASWIASVGGAIIAIHGVYRIVRRWWS